MNSDEPGDRPVGPPRSDIGAALYQLTPGLSQTAACRRVSDLRICRDANIVPRLASQLAATRSSLRRLTVEDRIDEAKEAADRVENNEGLGLLHRETDQHGLRALGRLSERSREPEPRAGRGSPGEASER